MTQALVTILVPHFKTLELTKLCLRLLRKHTPHHLAEVIVIDNDSQDASLTYLRHVSWIKLIERKAIPGESPIQSHARALDMGLAEVKTPYVLSIHTDTLVKHPEWLTFLISQIEKNNQIAGVGSWKLELKPVWRQVLKKVESTLQLAYYALIGKKSHGVQGVGDNHYYLRSHCAMYRVDLLRQLNLHFAVGCMVAGKEMHKQLVDAGFEMVFLSSEQLIQYLEHINHATSVLNPYLSTREKSVEKGMRRIKACLDRFNADEILCDASLD